MVCSGQPRTFNIDIVLEQGFAFLFWRNICMLSLTDLTGGDGY